jgi:hypothetical protein
LAHEFQKRDWFAVVQHDPYLALAELALRERAQTARAAWGLQRMEGLALVVVEPARWPEASMRDLFSAVRRWLPPSVTIWTATEDRIERAAEPAAIFATEPATNASPDFDALIAALPRRPIASVSSNGEEAATTQPRANRAVSKPERLSREEIDMLLYEDEHSNNPPPGEGER